MTAAENPAGLFREEEGGVVFRVRVIPRAASTAISGSAGGVLRVRLTAPPVEGKANRALLKYLSGIFGVAAGRLAILRGEAGREKVIRVEGLTAAEAAGRLERFLRSH